MSKKSHFREPFHKQHGKRDQTLLKSASQHLSHIHRSLPRKLNSEKSLLLTCKILGLLVDTLAANGKYLVIDRDNLKIPVQIQSSHKKKTFSEFFVAFLKCGFNFKHFEKKDDPHRFCIFEVRDSKNVVR